MPCPSAPAKAQLSVLCSSLELPFSCSSDRRVVRAMTDTVLSHAGRSESATIEIALSRDGASPRPRLRPFRERGFFLAISPPACDVA